MDRISQALMMGGDTGPVQGQTYFLYEGQPMKTWVAPPGVTSICVVCVGGGAGGYWGSSSPGGGAGGGGGLGWKNNISVTPGTSYTVAVGSRGGSGKRNIENAFPGGISYFANTSTVVGYGGSSRFYLATGATNYGSGGGYVGDGGGNGGNWGGANAGGAGGAGGYSGNGGNGGSINNSGTSGSGGGGGGGGGGSTNVIQVGPNNGEYWEDGELYGYQNGGGSGGGVCLFGQGSSGAGGLNSSFPGNDGTAGSVVAGKTIHGAGGRSGYNLYYWNAADWSDDGANGQDGGVRIIWGPGRAFPSTNTGDVT